MRKLDIKKIVEAMKPAKDLKKAPTPEVKQAVSGVKVRDMRQEAKDLGSHGSHEFFGGEQV